MASPKGDVLKPSCWRKTSKEGGSKQSQPTKTVKSRKSLPKPEAAKPTSQGAPKKARKASVENHREPVSATSPRHYGQYRHDFLTQTVNKLNMCTKLRQDALKKTSSKRKVSIKKVTFRDPSPAQSERKWQSKDDGASIGEKGSDDRATPPDVVGPHCNPKEETDYESDLTPIEDSEDDAYEFQCDAKARPLQDIPEFYQDYGQLSEQKSIQKFGFIRSHCFEFPTSSLRDTL
ncbi:hypothetical protein ONZ45_g8189 [Pleurotus djamor]|nr:hypothetical protein ONZ45_g8189 [Pleurotus djamor]